MTKSKCQNKFKIQMSLRGEAEAISLNAGLLRPACSPRNDRRIYFFTICALSLFWILCFGICHYSFAQDKIIAIVNNECITQKDLNDFLNFMRLQLAKEYKPQEIQEKIKSLRLDLLDKLVDDRIILQEAKKNKTTVDESRVKAKISEIKKEYRSETEFQADLANQGLVQADIEKKIREQLLMYAVIEDKVRSKITVNPAEVTDFYNNNLKDFILKEEREVTSVTLGSLDLAKSFVYNLKAGAKIEDLAGRYPLVVSPIKAVKDGTLRQDIERAIFGLSIGEISAPVKIDDKYYVFRLERITGQRQQSLSEVEDEVFAFLMEKKMQEKFTNWLNEIKKQAYITIK